MDIYIKEAAGTCIRLMVVLSLWGMISACSSLARLEPDYQQIDYPMIAVPGQGYRYLAEPALWPEYPNLQVVRSDLSLVAAPMFGSERSADWGKLESQLQQLLEQQLAAQQVQGRANTLVLRWQMLDLAASSPALNVLSTALLFVPVTSGGVLLEAELIDPQSGQCLAYWLWHKTGSPLQFRQSFNRYGHARYATEQFAQEVLAVIEVQSQGLVIAQEAL